MPVSEQEFIRVWTKYGSGPQVAEALGTTLRGVLRRRKSIEEKLGITLHADMGSGVVENRAFFHRHHMARADAKLYNGQIFIASDCHYHPGEPSVAHKAFVKLIKKHKPDIICLNGDVFDGATISRYPKASWDAVRPPTVKEELEAVSNRLHEIESVAGNALKVWTIGNHDLRFEARLCQAAPQYEGVQGFALRDHFPGWQHCLSMMVNDVLMVKHRFHNGLHATFNNVLRSGLHISTGHLHRLQATIWSDYKGSRFGIDSGTLAEINGEHMSYGEDNPVNHASGFVVLTFINGTLVYPEFCYVVDGVAYFRGQAV